MSDHSQLLTGDRGLQMEVHWIQSCVGPARSIASYSRVVDKVFKLKPVVMHVLSG